jgi:hypothetical protein
MKSSLGGSEMKNGGTSEASTRRGSTLDRPSDHGMNQKSFGQMIRRRAKLVGLVACKSERGAWQSARRDRPRRCRLALGHDGGGSARAAWREGGGRPIGDAGGQIPDEQAKHRALQRAEQETAMTKKRLEAGGDLKRARKDLEAAGGSSFIGISAPR